MSTPNCFNASNLKKKGKTMLKLAVSMPDFVAKRENRRYNSDNISDRGKIG